MIKIIQKNGEGYAMTIYKTNEEWHPRTPVHREVEVSGVNRYGFKVITTHGSLVSAEFQRRWLAETGCKEIN